MTGTLLYFCYLLFLHLEKLFLSSSWLCRWCFFNKRDNRGGRQQVRVSRRHYYGQHTWRSRSEAGLIRCWNKTPSARFCCSRSKTRVRSFRHSSLRSWARSNTGDVMFIPCICLTGVKTLWLCSSRVHQMCHESNIARFHNFDGLFNKGNAVKNKKQTFWVRSACTTWLATLNKQKKNIIECNLAALAQW